MSSIINWSNFYNTLCRVGPDLLIGIDEELRSMMREISLNTDMFWSEELHGLLEEHVASGKMREGVILTIEQWRENVLATLEADFSIDLNWQSFRFDVANPLIDELIKAISYR